MSDYDDIIHLPHPTSKRHPRMSSMQRAAQFAPFAALTGHDEAIAETARWTDHQKTLDDSGIAMLNMKLTLLNSIIETQPQIQITYFVPDRRKEGGKYIKEQGALLKIDSFLQQITLSPQKIIPMKDITDISVMVSSSDQ